MVRTLQRKFIVASMLAVTILLLTLVGATNVLNAVSVTQRQGRILDILCSTDAHPETALKGKEGIPEDGQMPDQTGRGQLQSGRRPERPASPRQGQGPEDRKDGRSLFGRTPSVDNALSARFFAVWVDAQDGIVRTDVSRIFAVDEETAREYAQEILSLQKSGGTWNGFRFLVRECAEEVSDSAAAGGSEPAAAMVSEPAAPGASELAAEMASEPAAAAEEGQRLLVAMDITGDRDSLLSVLGISSLIAALCWIAMLFPVHALARRAIAPTATSIERQKQFVTNAGHELKTPLAIIQTNIDALELYNGESKWTRNIRAQTVRLSGLMQNLLTLSKMDETGLQPDPAPFRLDLLAGEVWEDFAASAQARDLTVRFDLPAEGGVEAFGNRDSIAQLFSILYDNAVKYTPRRGEIFVQVRKTAEGAEIMQSNTISPDSPGYASLREEPERLFERFYRADADRSRKKGGYGIGLSAAKAIAGANRGTIRAAFEQDRLCFTVRLAAASPPEH
ncbi:MAG: HAMP domain-containing sensor histidine kinase [Eubacteriales bacterium]|nr:HAMP domain-containing sensor histidine kinase [Eubacteriales bacterium]